MSLPVRTSVLGAVVLVLVSSCSSGKAPSAHPGATRSASASVGPTATATASDGRFTAAHEALKAATVELVHRASPLTAWAEECTGTKIRLGHRVYVLTARHCIADRINTKVVFPSLSAHAQSLTAPDLNRAVDVTSRLVQQLGIRAVGSDGRVEGGEPTAVVRAVVRWYPDVALLSVARSARFDAVPALDYVPGVELGLEDAEVATAGIPAAASGRRLQGRGTYLGRVQNPNDPAQLLDLVGIHPTSPRTDACNYGASGSLAVISPTSFTGPLALRNNVVNRAGSNGEDDPRFDRSARAGMAEQLGRSLAGYATICGYAELPGEVLDGLVAKSE